MTAHRRLEELLRAQTGDAGCTAGEEILDAYVELELAGEDPARVFPGTAIHLRSCPGCQADHDGLLEAARRFATSRPDSRPSRARTLAWNREPVEGVERGDHGHAQDGEQDAEQRTDREPGESELEAPADGCRAC